MAHPGKELSPEARREIRSAAAKRLWESPVYRKNNYAERVKTIKRLKETKLRRQIAESVARARQARDNGDELYMPIKKKPEIEWLINAGSNKNSHAFVKSEVFSLCERVLNGNHLSTTLPTDVRCKLCEKRTT